MKGLLNGVFPYVSGTTEEILQFNGWIGTLPHKHKIVIAGNHERSPNIIKGLLTNCIFLEDETLEVEGIKIYGSVWKADFEKIPKNVDILMTHRPPSRPLHFCH